MNLEEFQAIYEDIFDHILRKYWTDGISCYDLINLQEEVYNLILQYEGEL